jgi:hypothetical protein
MRPAYKTRLGNLTAKSVLVLLADQVNAEGFGWPSIDFIVKGTEINKRTVLRVIQIFGEINLLTKVHRGPKRTLGIQLNLERLGSDLSSEYSERLHVAEGEAAGYERPATSVPQTCGKCLTDTPVDVSQTPESVSQTPESVSQTFPPHPHKGGPVNDPLMTHPPTPHRGTVRPISPEREEELRAVDRATEAVMQGCGFTDSRLVPVLRKVIQLEADKGVIPPRAAVTMAAQWKSYTAQAERLRFKWTAKRFFSEGYWNKADAWPWDAQVLREQAQATAGRYH